MALCDLLVNHLEMVMCHWVSLSLCMSLRLLNFYLNRLMLQHDGRLYLFMLNAYLRSVCGCSISDYTCADSCFLRADLTCKPIVSISDPARKTKLSKTHPFSDSKLHGLLLDCVGLSLLCLNLCACRCIWQSRRAHCATIITADLNLHLCINQLYLSSNTSFLFFQRKSYQLNATLNHASLGHRQYSDRFLLVDCELSLSAWALSKASIADQLKHLFTMLAEE